MGKSREIKEEKNYEPPQVRFILLYHFQKPEGPVVICLNNDTHV